MRDLFSPEPRGAGVVNRNPCPVCDQPPQFVCGAVAFPDVPAAKPLNFLICWTCGQIMRLAAGEVWKSIRVPRHKRKAAA